MNFAQIDRSLIWHPFTHQKDKQENIVITHAEGPWLYDDNGKRYLDAISSWWVNLHGHAHPKIAEAIYEQAKKLEHIIFAGFTHEPAIRLVEQGCEEEQDPGLSQQLSWGHLRRHECQRSRRVHPRLS